jgi:hypothetical protein
VRSARSRGAISEIAPTLREASEVNENVLEERYDASVGIDTNRRAAVAFGIAVPVLQTCRTVCFGHMPETWGEWPIAMDAYVTGALLLVGAWAASRHAQGRALLSVGWGFSCGILYRSFFEQLADPSRHARAHLLVLGFKGILLLAAMAGLAGAILSATSKSEVKTVGP